MISACICGCGGLATHEPGRGRPHIAERFAAPDLASQYSVPLRQLLIYQEILIPYDTHEHMTWQSADDVKISKKLVKQFEQRREAMQEYIMIPPNGSI